MNRLLNIFISHPSDMLTDSRPHGDGLVADRIIRHLAARGHRIHIAVAGYELREPYSSNVFLYPIRSGSGGALSRLRFAIGARQTLRRLLRKESIDLVHQLNPVVTGLSLAFWNAPLPVVLGPYVPDWPLIYNGRLQKPRRLDRLKIRIRKEIWQLQHKIASAIILSTPAAIEKIRNPAALQSKIHVIPYGIDTNVFSASNVAISPAILFVGLLMQHKGIFVLLEAFRLVLESVPGCKLILAGVGSEMDMVRQVASKLPDPSRVEFLGHIQHEEIPDVMRQCTVCCIPSFGEAFGLVAIEAMACSRPVVGTDAGGLAYLISEKGGCKVQVGQVEELAHSLIMILSNPSLARSMGEHNRGLAESLYAWPQVISQLEDAYEAALCHYERGSVR